jgi:hypothetical protein
MRCLLVLSILAVATVGCGKSFVEADAIHRDEVAKLEGFKTELAAKQADATAQSQADARGKVAAEVERRKPLIASWQKTHPKPLSDRLPVNGPFRLSGRIGELEPTGPLGKSRELARRHAKELANSTADLMRLEAERQKLEQIGRRIETNNGGTDVLPDDLFSMEIWTEIRRKQKPDVFLRVAKAGKEPLSQAHIEALDEVENGGFSFLFAPSPGWASQHPRPTYSM